MHQENISYGADSGYHMPIPGMTGGGDTYEERESEEPRVHPEPISDTALVKKVRNQIGKAGVELS